jgi:DNA-binding PadR family transcriptional regulator
MASRRSATDHLLEYIALGLLINGPNHGYDLHQELESTFGTVWQAGRSKLYATLAKLEARGDLMVTREPQADRPPRKVYALTDAGRKRFEQWLIEPTTQPREVRTVIPVKLRFFEMLERHDADALLDAQIAICTARIERERKRWAAEAGDVEEQSSSQAEPPVLHDDLFYDLIFEFRRRQLLGMIDWLKYCKTRLTSAEAQPHG